MYLPGNQSPFPHDCWLTSHHTVAQLCQWNMTRVGIGRSWWCVWVCTCGEDRKLNHRMVYHCYSSLLQPCAPKSVIPLNIDAVALRPWDQWPPRSLCLSHSEAGSEPESRPAGLDRITDAKCTEAGTRDVGEKIRDSPRLPAERKRAWWEELIILLTGNAPLSFHFHISRTNESVCFGNVPQRRQLQGAVSMVSMRCSSF